MHNFGTLVIHGSDEVSVPLVEALRRLDMPTDTADNGSDAVVCLERMRYEGVLLDDNLPQGGSLEVLQGLERHGNPRVLMIMVPRSRLLEARANAPDDVEFVANPQTDEDVHRLASRVRSRLIDAGLSEKFVVAPRRQTIDEADDQSVPSPRTPHTRKPLLTVLAVLAVLLALLLVLRLVGQAGSSSVGGYPTERARLTVSTQQVAWRGGLGSLSVGTQGTHLDRSGLRAGQLITRVSA